jgi:FkbM family methyltransferase
VAGVSTVRAVLRELRAMRALAADSRSFRTYATDIVVHRLLRLPAPFRPRTGALRTLRLANGVEFTYRRERGDIYTVREVWLDEAYRLPPDFTADVIVDLGAHIGLASLWLASRYRPSKIIAVEPSPDNARLARENFARNGIAAELIEAAVGATDGEGWFQEGPQSNLGRLGKSGHRVRTISVATLLERVGSGVDVDVLKLDVEGAEVELLAGSSAWLERVRLVVAELHAAPSELEAIASTLRQAGLRQTEVNGRATTDTVCFARNMVPTRSDDDLGVTGCAS